MPHSKYYQLDAWEMQQYSATSSAAASRAEEDDGSEFVFNDEEQRRRELLRDREISSRKEFSNVMSTLAGDREKREGLRGQEILRGQLQVAYRLGDNDEVKRLEKLLAPVKEVSDGVAHPWA